MSGDGVIGTVGDAVAGVPLAEAVVDAAEAVVEDQSAMGLLAAVVSIGSEVSSAVQDPIGTFFASGVGWVIEAIPALKSSLDAVSGNPDKIEDLSELWTEKVATPLAGVADAVRTASSATSSGWSGVDADAYRKATTALAEHSEALGTAARATATGLSIAGALVVEVRNFIRDELASLAVWAAASYAAATASSVPTGGASVVAATNSILLRGASGRGWWFRTDGPDVAIEPSVHIDAGLTRRSLQIVVRGSARTDSQTKIRWKLSPAGASGDPS